MVIMKNTTGKKKKKPTQTYYVIDYSLYAKYIYIIYIL